MRLSVTLLFTTVSLFYAFSQGYSIVGFVHDGEHDAYMSAATVSLLPIEKHVQTDKNGFFQFEGLDAANYMLKISFISYNDLLLPIKLSGDTLMHLHIYPSPILLEEVRINAHRSGSVNIASALSVTEISKNYLFKNSSSNFIQALSSIAGISSMDIGAGFSKPVIRGFGFNRVAVVDKGVIQQNQQWGADHGLDIDQFDVDGVRVHKGPMSLFYGSDAIGGVIEILPPTIPQEDLLWGDATLIAKTNNDLIGASVVANMKRDNLFLRGRATVQSYADYRVPVDTIEYLTWRLPVYNGRMKNSAGREFNLSFSANYNHVNFNSWLQLSDIYSKNGFFPGAHGLPSIERLLDDGNVRNIDLPNSASNHFKMIWNNEWRISNNDKLLFDFGYQQNRREELSAFHTHYGNQKAPELKPDLELQFILNTYSVNSRYLMDENEKWSKTVGVTAEYQHNKIGGYSFLMPDFERLTSGLYLINSYRLGEKFFITGGVRYDIGKLIVNQFYDSMLEEYLMMQNYNRDDVEIYAMRSVEINRTFNNLSGSVGFEYNPSKIHNIKINIGRSFRYPGANELASNGLHHGAFRHEQGNIDLDSESGYQIDLDYKYETERLDIKLNPFLSWFKNYIYLEPTGVWSVLPHAGQIYRYNETEAIMAGGELLAGYEITNRWKVSGDFAYVYNRNILDKYALPFTPPTVITTDITYSGTDNKRKLVSDYELKLENRWIMNQNLVTRNELTTPGAMLWNFSAYTHWHIGGKMYIILLQVENIFNTPFMNHLSFYRKLNAPEPGRNIQLIVKVPF